MRIRMKRCNICNKTIWFDYDIVSSKLYSNLGHDSPPTKHDKPSATYYYHKTCDYIRLIEENVELRNELHELKQEGDDNKP